MKNSFNKKLILLVASVFFFSLLLVFGANRITAQETQPAATTYELLAPLPGYVDSGSGSGTTAAQYIQGIFRLVIALAGALAVLTIIFGGIKYMSTDAFGGKNEAKEIISRALWGFALAIGAWMILYTISPGENNPFVNFNLSLERQEIRGGYATSSGPGIIGSSAGNSWPSDLNIRNGFTNHNININRSNCTEVGQGLPGYGGERCTSLTGLSWSLVSLTNLLALRCNCPVTITGGTEYWLHGNRSTELNQNPTAHRPGGNVIDFSLSDELNRHIRENGTRTTASGCAPGSEKYRYLEATFVLEGDHWHVCR